MGFLAARHLGEHVLAERVGKKLPPLRIKMATNQGITSARAHGTPIAGFSRHSQCAERSAATSAIAANPTNMRITGPLIQDGHAIALQNITA